MSETHEQAAFLSPSSLKIPHYMPFSAWTGHAAFAFWLVEALAPRSVVELGVHHGYSYFVLCQAVNELGLTTACYGVDTWQGDEHALFYNKSVFEAVTAINTSYQNFSKLMQMTFSEALSFFPEKSVDLLHIDGRHYYQDVKDDFESWLPKMSESGVVLLHDTMVRERNFGVWRFLEELRDRYPVFNFAHCHGLGVVAVGTIPHNLKALFKSSAETKDVIRLAYARLGEDLQLRHKTRDILSSLNHKLGSRSLLGFSDGNRAPFPGQSLEIMDTIDVALTQVVRDKVEATSLVGRSRLQTPSSQFPRFLRRRWPFSWMPNYRSLKHNYEVISESPLFDPTWYRNAYKNVEEKGEDPIHHFIKFGNEYSLSPGPLFDTRAYFDQNPGVKQSGKNPLLHYLNRSDTETIDLGTAPGNLTRLPPDQTGASRDSAPPMGLPKVPDLFILRDYVPKCRIAIVMHVFYPEDIQEIFRRCSYIEEPYDLFVSLVEGHSDFLYDSIKERFIDAFVYVFQNHGRDILPFMVFLNSGVLFKYELICKVHTKRSPHIDDGMVWRNKLLDGILPSAKGAKAIIDAFDADPDLGIIVADDEIYQGAECWSGNLHHVSNLSLLLGYELKEMLQLPFAGGSILWIRPFLLYDLFGLGLAAEAFEPEPLGIDGSLAHVVERLFSVSCAAAGMRIVTTSSATEIEHRRDPSAKPRILAFYLPQFHPIAENDAWWGRGFTEWTNVTKAKALFKGHRQPRLPGELGFTDLRVPETREAQADLAASFGLSGFCYYYYWFSGRKRMLHRPIDEVLASGRPDFPFMICWANEPWSRNWDGRDHEVLLAQDYLDGWEEEFVADVAPILKDRRYLRTCCDKLLPMLFIYRIMHLPEPTESIKRLRVALKRAGVGEVHLAAGRFRLGADPVLPDDPAELGLDAYFEFPPHQMQLVEVSGELMPASLAGTVYNYAASVTAQLAAVNAERQTPGQRHPGVMMGWDNTARRKCGANVFHGATPSHFRRWVRGIVQKSSAADRGGERLLLVNAWNEWAEGSCLEPDRDFGRGWLEALRSALGRVD